MNQILLHQSIETEAQYSFARSGGPGGQNVNKVNTKVFISIPVDKLQGLSAVEMERITAKLYNRLNSEGLLTISVEDERSQFRNREIALQRIEAIIVHANFQEKRRIPTKPGKSAILRRLGTKQLKSRTKTNRNKPSTDD